MSQKRALISVSLLLFTSFCLYLAVDYYERTKITHCEWSYLNNPTLLALSPRATRQIHYVDIVSLKDKFKFDISESKFTEEKDGFVFVGSGHHRVFKDVFKPYIFNYTIWIYDLLPRSKWESWVNAVRDLPNLQGVDCNQITRAQYASIVNILEVTWNEFFDSPGRLEWESGELAGMVGHLISNIYVDTKNRYILSVRKTVVRDSADKIVKEWVFAQMRGNKGAKSYVYTLTGDDENQIMEAFIRTAIAQLN